MSRYDEPTQRVHNRQPPAAPLPGSLDPLRGHQPEHTETGTGWVETPETEIDDVAAPAETGVLPLDEIFAGPAEAAADRTPTVTADAPTWTAMPVVPVRSGPVPAGPPNSTWPEPHDKPARPPRRESIAVSWAETRTRFEDWLRRDDNGLMLLTAVVACVLIIVVAGVGG
jgi:hypothetical protein